MSIFSAIVDRVKNALVISAANQVEVDLSRRHAEQKAELHRQAKAYDAEGLSELAAELREKAAALDVARPLAAVQPGTGYVLGDDGRLALTASAEPAKALPPAAEPEAAKPKKKAKATE